MRRYLVYGILLVLAIVLGTQVYREADNLKGLTSQYNSLAAQVSSVNTDNQKLQQDIDYYADPHNLEKELRSRLNYRLPGESLMIVVPNASPPSGSQE